MKYSLRSLMIAVTVGPLVLAIFLMGWRQAIPREARLVADVVGICAFGFNVVVVALSHRGKGDWAALPYVCLNLIPPAALALDLIAP